jgi:superfamily II DNA helicase RecQ
VLVSPEIAISGEFQKAVLAKDPFVRNLRVVNIDEAHCMNVWGGSFRPDYAALGLLRGRFPGSVPFLVASATLPEHVLDDIRGKLKLARDVEMIQLTNARPNVALSVRVLEHSEDSKGDLRFLIPPEAKQPMDVPITLVYCNQRSSAEDSADRAKDWAEEHGLPTSCIAFYHALIGQERKHEIEDELRAGSIRILFCTEALGMVSQLYI